MSSASGTPMTAPITMAMAIQRNSTISDFISVPTIARSIPISPALTPLRAVLGWLSHFSDMMKPTAEIR
jgi:hypothetical protein